MVHFLSKFQVDNYIGIIPSTYYQTILFKKKKKKPFYLVTTMRILKYRPRGLWSVVTVLMSTFILGSLCFISDPFFFLHIFEWGGDTGDGIQLLHKLIFDNNKTKKKLTVED